MSICFNSKNYKILLRRIEDHNSGLAFRIPDARRRWAAATPCPGLIGERADRQGPRMWRRRLVGSTPKSGGRPGMSPHEQLKPDHNSDVRPGVRDTHMKTESTDTTTPAVPASDNNWRWARRIEADERVAEAALRKEEAAAMKALEQDG